MSITADFAGSYPFYPVDASPLTEFYPENAPIPSKLSADEFVLSPLRTTHVEPDYAAVMSSREMLRRWSGSSWPPDDFTLAEDLEDLRKHEQEHLERKAFTFTVMNPSETECLGCVYICALAYLLRCGVTSTNMPATTRDYESAVRFWVRQSRLADGLDKCLLSTLIAWFEQEWSFSRVSFYSNDQDTRQARILVEAGLEPYYSLHIPSRVGKYTVYG